MKPARLAATVVATVALSLTLAGCDQPNPNATLFSGTTSQSKQAACWADEGATINLAACQQDVLDRGKAAVVPVVPGQVIGISVDPVVADAGWSPQVNGQNVAGGTLNGTYFRFTYPEFSPLPADGVVLSVVAGEAGSERGVWVYHLVPAA